MALNLELNTDAAVSALSTAKSAIDAFVTTAGKLSGTAAVLDRGTVSVASTPGASVERIVIDDDRLVTVL